MIHAGGGRVTGLHYGTYDYSASLGVAAEYQSLEHPVADHAKAVMQVARGTGVFVSDGSTNVLPVGDAEAVRAAWRLHARLVRRSLERGIYQGWDMHPAHLPSRYVATYSFFREGLAGAAARLRAYVHGGQSGFLDECDGRGDGRLPAPRARVRRSRLRRARRAGRGRRTRWPRLPGAARKPDFASARPAQSRGLCRSSVFLDSPY